MEEDIDNSNNENKTIREQWQELGFYYECRDQERLWYITGSMNGLLHFYTILLNYINKEQYNDISEHEHYGPYMDLEIMTWNKAGINSHSIHGTKNDLKKLADIFLSKLQSSSIGDQFTIKCEYAPDTEYSILVKVRGDNFDPFLLDR